ncbi:MAG: glycosyltransferase, partial [Vulcanimicrobiaceae bacterium]
MISLSVVIATRDRAPLLAHALASLAAQRDAPAFETLVVDNGSRDETAATVAAAAAGGAALRLVAHEEPNR